MTSTSQVRRIGVVGAGTMGAGIAGLAARQGFDVVLYDLAAEQVAAGREAVDGALDRALAKGRIDADAVAAARARIAYSTALEDLGGAELVVEAIPERADLKGDLLARLAVLAPRAILASNTSSLSIADLAERSGAPERVLGLHFFNPPGTMRLVELVATARTDPATVARARAAAQGLGKDVVQVADGPGFLVNRCARPYYLEALRMVEDGAAGPADIDRACVELGGFPLGPFELMDVIGIDVSLAVTRSMWEQAYGEPRWRPSPIQARMAAEGRLGRKTGGGFYAAGAGWRDAEPTPGVALEPLLHRIVVQLVNEAAFALDAGVASAADVDRAMTIGLRHPQGPGGWVAQLGADRVAAALDALWEREHDQRYRVAPGLRRAAAGAPWGG